MPPRPLKDHRQPFSTASVATLQRAQKNVGGRRDLASLLNVKLADLDNWILGRQLPPSHVFLRALDLAFRRTLPVGLLSQLAANEDEWNRILKSPGGKPSELAGGGLGPT